MVLVAVALAYAAFAAPPATAYDRGPLAPRFGAGLPSVLSPADVARYREIFRLQEEGRWALADRHIKALESRVLIGHVLFQRYMHPTAYRSSYTELRDWLANYHDHPGARQIYDLALVRKPRKSPPPREPLYGYRPAATSTVPSTALDPLWAQQSRIEQRIREFVRQGRSDLAASLLSHGTSLNVLTPLRYDQAAADVAMSYYIAGDDEKAYEFAAPAARRSGRETSMPDWVAGLAAVRLGRLEAAAVHFENHALSAGAGPWNISAGAFWAARMHLLTKRPQRVEKWMRVAADQPHTFYGILARRALGLDSVLDFSQPLITGADVERVMKLPGGRRALALVELGQIVLAEEELRVSVSGVDPMTARSLVAVADYANLPQIAVRSGNRLVQMGGARRDRALYPVPPWQPEKGFKLDRALIYAFMRQESAFDSRATSHAGARGLMQLMPTTASYMSPDHNFVGRVRDVLYEPDLNIGLGQEYLSYLLRKPEVDGDLFKLAVAYNAGQGNLRKWLRSVRHEGDPLLFIESLPSRETRIFVERVMANLWIYRQRFGQATPSLDAVASGEWPRYEGVDQDDTMVAEDVQNR